MTSILESDQRDGSAAEVHRPGTLKELVLQSRPCQHDVQRHAGSGVNERHHPSPTDELRR